MNPDILRRLLRPAHGQNAYSGDPRYSDRRYTIDDVGQHQMDGPWTAGNIVSDETMASSQGRPWPPQRAEETSPREIDSLLANQYASPYENVNPYKSSWNVVEAWPHQGRDEAEQRFRSNVGKSPISNPQMMWRERNRALVQMLIRMLARGDF